MYYVALCLDSVEEAQLPQLSTLGLALKSDGPFHPGCPWTPCSPAQCSLGPRTLQMIYYPEKGSAQPLLTSFSILLPFISLHSLNPVCQPCYTLSLFLKEKFTSTVQSCLFHFIVNLSFILSLLLIPFFLSVAAREHKDYALLVMFF